MSSEKRRKKYQVFTPKETVKRMLDEIGYKGNGIINKSIADISCGDGAFLTEALSRYILACQESNKTPEEIRQLVKDHIVGYEIEEGFYQECITRFNDKMNSEFKTDIIDTFPNIKNTDGLNANETNFDFVVGNPPYVSYKEMTKEQRDYLSENFFSCKKSKFDYSYAFVEKSIDLLKESGVAVMITPINMYRIKSGELMRSFLKHKLFKIIDVTEEKIFPGVLTNPVISVFKKDDNKLLLEYEKKTKTSSLSIDSFFKGTSLANNEKPGRNRFGDHYTIHNGVATLLNKAFIVSNDTNIEKSVLMNACSPKNFRYSIYDKIVFPYSFNNGKLVRYDEKVFKESFPNAYKHLSSFKDDLAKRDVDKNCKWFEYGRSQALAYMNKKKLLISSIVTNEVLVFELSENDVPFAGFFITSIDPIKYPLEEAKALLNSKKMYNYLKYNGIKMNGNSFRFSCEILKEFRY